MNGDNVELLLEFPELNDPVGISVDPFGGRLYWAQSFGDRIYRADLNGDNAELLLEFPELDDAVGLAILPTGSAVIPTISFHGLVVMTLCVFVVATLVYRRLPQRG